MKSFPIDPFLILLLTTVAVASIFPCYGDGKIFFDWLSTLAIALLFFMHGAKLNLSTIIDAFLHWRLHLLIIAITFGVFPLIGLSLGILSPTVIPHEIYVGILFLCALPSTVQSAIAFTSIAKGNVAAAVCSASASTLLGVFITPLLVTLFIQDQGQHSIPLLDTIGSIMLKLILPFVLGNIARRWIGKWIDKHKFIINKVDRSSILLVVYVAFSDAVINGIWSQIDWYSLVIIAVTSIFILSLVLFLTVHLSRLLKFNKEDEIAIVFCGSKKSLASGIPMASIIFPINSVGVIILPLMLFHQLQLMVCAYLAARYAKRDLKLKTE